MGKVSQRTFTVPLHNEPERLPYCICLSHDSFVTVMLGIAVQFNAGQIFNLDSKTSILHILHICYLKCFIHMDLGRQ